MQSRTRSRTHESIAQLPTPTPGADDSYEQSAVFMDTVVAVQVVRPHSPAQWAERVEHAFAWFRDVEQRCSRFDPQSELMRLCAQPGGRPTPVSPLLFEAIRFAVSIAEASDGAFDPTVGASLEAAGFNRNYRTGTTISHGIAPSVSSYRDIVLDPLRHTIELRRPLVLDLGAVAKGLAVDLAAHELTGYADFAVEAGGDMLVHGRNPAGQPWAIAVRDPHDPDAVIDVVRVSDAAICTSGGYERVRASEGGHHIVDPTTGRSPAEVASVTVIAATAMAADALATAAFVLGPSIGREFLTRHGADGLFVLPSGERVATEGWSRYQP